MDETEEPMLSPIHTTLPVTIKATFVGRVDPPTNDEAEVEPVDDISNLRYRKGLWETRGGLFD